MRAPPPRARPHAAPHALSTRLRAGSLLLLPAVALLSPCAAHPAPPAPASPQPTPVTYDLTPFTRTTPALAMAWEALHGANASAWAQAREALTAQLAAARPPTRSVEEPAARLLLGRLLDRLGDRDAARAARLPLLADRGSLGDRARLDEAASLTTAQDAREAARLLWRVSSAVPGHVQAARRAVSLLTKQDRWREAARGLEGFLNQPLDPRTRRLLTRTAADLWSRAAKSERTRGARARDLDRAYRALRALWWTGPEGDGDAARALRAMGRPLTYGDQVARLVLQSTARSRRAVRARWRAVRKLRPRTVHDRRVRRWAQVLLDTRPLREADALTKPLRRLHRMARHLDGGPFAPFFRVGLASLLRRVDRDDEAIAQYDALVRDTPEHVLAPEARREAARLTAYLGRSAEAAARWEEAARALPRGPSQRLSLWHAGFEAWAAGDSQRAAAYLKRLRDAYGGERDATGLPWAARAGYWLGRVAEDEGDSGQAARWFVETAVRFPASYYALLARQRLAALAVPEPAAPAPTEASRTPAVARSPDLDWAVTLWRLGDGQAARRALENLLAVGRLPGSGRALLARLYEEAGQVRRAARLLRRGGVVASLPAAGAEGAPWDALRRAFSLSYRAELHAAAEANGLPLAFLAGLVHVESRFNPRARSAPGAVGLAQVMPKTARAVGRHLLGREVGHHTLRDPETNLAVGARLLRELLEHFGGNPALAVAAYNAGHGAVRGWLRSRGHLGTDAFVEAIPYGQARNYVRRVLSVAEIYRRLYTPSAPPLYVPPSLPLTLGPFFEEARP